MISEKQKQIMAFPFTDYDALIADGAIRSGKTSFMMLSFVDDAMRRFNNQRFGICGKTVDSTVKNIIAPFGRLDQDAHTVRRGGTAPEVEGGTWRQNSISGWSGGRLNACRS